MLRLAPSLCPFCEVRALFTPLRPSWQPTRTAATLQKRKPSRMVLSSDVKRGPSNLTAGGRASRKSRNSPFGSTNLTSVPRNLQDGKNRISPAEQRRVTRNSNGKKEQKTKEPMKALKMQRALANVSYEKRGRVREAIGERRRFEEFDLLPIIQESISAQALGGLVDVSPTPIQRLAIPALLAREERRESRRRRRSTTADKQGTQQFLLAAETGSGKTLAYLLPVIDALKRAEAAESAQAELDNAKSEEPSRPYSPNNIFSIDPPTTNEPSPSTARPRAIILVPTAELVEQVGAVLKNLSHTVKYRSALVSANYTGKVIRSRLFSTGGIDVVVCTPHLLSSITESDPNILSRVSHLVVDEADSLLDRSFAPTTSAIIDRAAPSLQQLILCSATIPRSLDAYLHKRFPDLRRLVTPNLHAIPRRVQLSVVDIDKIPYQGNRDLACAQIIWEIGKEGVEQGEEREKRVVVFVNEREKTEELADYLRKKGIDAAALSRDSDARKQADLLASFTSSTSTPPSKSAQNLSPSTFTSAISPSDLPMQTHQQPPTPLTRGTGTGKTLPNTHVLITTDIASRGIDTTPVRHVILYDVPHTSVDFIHRLGRAGRMGRRGRGVVLVGRQDRKDVVREVREGMFKGMALI